MVEYLGEYVYEEWDPAQKTHVKTFNILLEWGKLDLDEFFFDQKIASPVRTKEILKLYQNIFEIAEAIKRIHKLEKDENGERRVYYGWHCDIKPDNILVMKDGKFKLADFGFAKFKLRREGDTEPAQESIPNGTAYSMCYSSYVGLQTNDNSRCPRGRSTCQLVLGVERSNHRYMVFWMRSVYYSDLGGLGISRNPSIRNVEAPCNPKLAKRERAGQTQGGSTRWTLIS
jgi:serine/threonine protein kinase